MLKRYLCLPLVSLLTCMPCAGQEAIGNQLMQAAEMGDVDTVRAVIARGVDPNARVEGGATPLMPAAAMGFGEIVEILLNAGADVNARNDFGASSLTFASGNRRSSIVQTLLEHGADANARDDDGNLPLVVASRGGDLVIVQALLGAGADVNAADPMRFTALIEASNRGEREIVHTLIEAGADVNAMDGYGRTALARATIRGHRDIVRLLSAAGAKEMSPPPVGADAGLLEAAARGDTATVKRLLAQGGNLAVTDDSGRTALYRAVLGNHGETVAELLQAGADPNTTSKYGAPPVGVAAHWARRAILQALLDAGADINLRLEGGATPLMWSVRRREALALGFLMEAGADVTARDDYGNTAIHYWAQAGDARTLGLLLENGADINARNAAEFTPLLSAMPMRQVERAKALLEHGADPNSPSSDGSTPLMYAAYQGDPTLVDLLLKSGADPQARDAQGVTAYNLAMGSGNAEVLRMLDEALSGASRRRFAPEVAADIRRLMELYTGSKEELAEGLKSNLAMLETQLIATLPPGARVEEMVAFMVRSLEDVVDGSYEDLLLPMFSVYGDHFTPEEIKALVRFHETPLGRKSLQATQRAALESGQRWLQWQQRTSLEIERELAQEFPELGDMRVAARREAGETPSEERLTGATYANLTAGFELELPAHWRINSFVRSKTGGVAGFESANGRAAGAVLREAWNETPERYKQAVEFNLKDGYDEYEKLRDEEITLDARAASLMVSRVAASSGEVALKFLIGVIPEEGAITRISFWGPDALVSEIEADLEQTVKSYKWLKAQ